MLISVKGISAHYCLYCISRGAYLIRAKYRTAFKILAASLAARSYIYRSIERTANLAVRSLI